MTRYWPASLYGRVAWIVCGGLALAHVLTFWIILRERGDQGQSMMLAYVGRDVATSVAILDRIPPAERAAWLPRLARPHYTYRLERPPTGRRAPDTAAPVAAALARAVGAARIGIVVNGSPGSLLVPIQLTDGAPLLLELTPPRATVSHTTVGLLVLQFVALAAAAWWAVRLTVRPLSRLSAAADALTPGVARSGLDDGEGPREVVQAVRAFDAMQRRIDEHVAERLHLLAAISHDLQSPITRMKLRADLVSDLPLRDKLQADLDSMQGLVEEGLAYARTAQATQEPPRPVDLHALLDGIVCDLRDAGHPVQWDGCEGPPVVTRMQALRRVVTNLLDNAVKFGGGAELVVRRSPGSVALKVRDRGPGIPPHELEAVLRPFYRIEASRGRETGGTGLGLAIAHQLALALGGRIVLVNRTGGGLEVDVELPTD